MRISRLAILMAALACAGTAAVAGTVSVSFVDPSRFTDAGNSSFDEPGNLATLSRHLQTLGARWLPADQSLQVDVLDVDIAGTVLPSRVDASPLRTLRGRADWPRIHLRYTLSSGGTALSSADEWVQDMQYTRSSLMSMRGSDPLYDEKRMLDRWFREPFASHTAAR